MCGRYRIRKEFVDQLPADEFRETRIEPKFGLFHTRYNLAPTQPAPVVRLMPDGAAQVDLMRWNYRSHYRPNPLINAKSETVDQLPAFSKSFRERRCLVPAHGYYEWQERAGGKIPWHYHLKDDRLFMFAGLWQNQDGEDRFTILTTTPNALAEELHDRMPVILPRSSWQAWLNPAALPEDLKKLLLPYPSAEMETWPVTPRMNTFAFEDPECIKPVEDPDAAVAALAASKKKAPKKASPPTEQGELF